MDNRPGVYILEFPTGIYVGSSVHVRRRVMSHIADLKRGNHSNRFLQNVFEKHGEPAVRVECYCAEAEIIDREQEAIDRLSPRLNLSPTAGRNVGHKHSPETLAQMSAAAKQGWSTRERVVGVAQRERISSSLKGRLFSEETRRKISEAKTGRARSEEAKAGVSAGKRGRKIKQRGHAMTPEILAKIAETKARKRAEAEGREATTPIPATAA